MQRMRIAGPLRRYVRLRLEKQQLPLKFRGANVERVGMGASEFTTFAIAKDAAEAFRLAHDEARHMEGHGGYTGTIAEVSSYSHPIQLPPRVTAVKALGWAWAIADNNGASRVPAKHRELAERIARYMRDKWGPCACLKLNASETKQRKEAQGMKGTRAQAFAFSGLASC